MLHVLPAHPGGLRRDVSEDDDGPPAPHVLRSDAVSDLVGGVARHTEATAAPHGDPGGGGAHTDRLEGELRGVREVRISQIVKWKSELTLQPKERKESLKKLTVMMGLLNS